MTFSTDDPVLLRLAVAALRQHGIVVTLQLTIRQRLAFFVLNLLHILAALSAYAESSAKKSSRQSGFGNAKVTPRQADTATLPGQRSG